MSLFFGGKELIRILRKANAPVVMLASETSDPSRILQDAVGSSRGNLRLREHDVLDRMEAAHGRPQ